MSDLTALRKIAEDATPGPWELIDDDLRSAHPAMSRAGTYGLLRYSDGSGWEHDGDPQFIATFNPAVVLALLDVVEVAGALRPPETTPDLVRLADALDRLNRLVENDHGCGCLP